MVTQKNVGDRAARAWNRRTHPRVFVDGRISGVPAPCVGDGPQHRAGARDRNGAARKPAHAAKHVGEVKHDHYRTVVVLWGISGSTIVVMFLVFVLGVVLAGIKIAERERVGMNVVTMMFVDQDSLHRQGA